jgi:hypothetical protein
MNPSPDCPYALSSLLYALCPLHWLYLRPRTSDQSNHVQGIICAAVFLRMPKLFLRRHQQRVIKPFTCTFV